MIVRKKSEVVASILEEMEINKNTKEVYTKVNTIDGQKVETETRNRGHANLTKTKGEEQASSERESSSSLSKEKATSASLMKKAQNLAVDRVFKALVELRNIQVSLLRYYKCPENLEDHNIANRVLMLKAYRQLDLLAKFDNVF